MAAVLALWRRYLPWAWIALGISLTAIAFLSTVYSLAAVSWPQLAFSYLAVFWMGAAVRGIYLTHYRDSATVFGQLHAMNKLNTRFSRGEITLEEWTKGAEEALGRRPR